MELRTIYLICAVGGGAALVLRLVLMFIGVDHGDVPGDVDVHLDAAEHGGGYNFLSLQSIAGFFTMFGLVGLGLLQIRASEIASLLGGLAAGVFTAWCTAFIFYQMQKLQSSGTLVLSNAVGKTGTVYLKIPEKGTGVVNVSVQGAMRSFDAVSAQGQPIQTGSIVRVTGITGEKILIVTDDLAGSNPSL